MTPPAYTEEDIIIIRQMWADGMTMAFIGKTLNRTKNSIVGKVRRLELTPRPNPIGNYECYRHGKAVTPRYGKKYSLPPLRNEPIHVVAIVPELPKPQPIVRPPPVVRPLQRPSNLTCQYTQSERRPWVFCDQPTHWFMRNGQLKQSSYCQAHHTICSSRQQQEAA